MNYTNLNLPEATVKLLESKGGIKALADRDIAVENDDLEALRKVLKEAFPNAPDLKDDLIHYKYFVAWGVTFMACHAINLPSIPASILVKEIEEKPFQWGKLVWVMDEKSEWHEAIYLYRGTTCGCVAIEKDKMASKYYPHCQREKPKPSPLRITREMIKEKFNCQEFEIVNEKG